SCDREWPDPGACSMSEGERVLPRPDRDSAPYFEAAAEGRLAVPKCSACGKFHWYPSQFCPWCGGSEIVWPTLSAEGRVFSYTIVSHAIAPWLASKVPYVLGLIDLVDAPGVRLVTDLTDVSPGDVHIGMSVRATFEVIGERLGLVHFQRVRGD